MEERPRGGPQQQQYSCRLVLPQKMLSQKHSFSAQTLPYKKVGPGKAMEIPKEINRIRFDERIRP
jgi:hypothetical protein